MTVNFEHFSISLNQLFKVNLRSHITQKHAGRKILKFVERISKLVRETFRWAQPENIH